MRQPSPATLGTFTLSAAASGNHQRWKNKKSNTGLCFTCGRMPRVGQSAYCRTCRPKQAGHDTHYYAKRKVNTDPHSANSVLTADGLTTCHRCGAEVVRRSLWASCPEAERHTHK